MLGLRVTESRLIAEGGQSERDERPRKALVSSSGCKPRRRQEVLFGGAFVQFLEKQIAKPPPCWFFETPPSRPVGVVLTRTDIGRGSREHNYAPRLPLPLNPERAEAYLLQPQTYIYSKIYSGAISLGGAGQWGSGAIAINATANTRMCDSNIQNAPANASQVAKDEHACKKQPSSLSPPGTQQLPQRY